MAPEPVTAMAVISVLGSDARVRTEPMHRIGATRIPSRRSTEEPPALHLIVSLCRQALMPLLSYQAPLGTCRDSAVAGHMSACVPLRASISHGPKGEETASPFGLESCWSFRSDVGP